MGNKNRLELLHFRAKHGYLLAQILIDKLYILAFVFKIVHPNFLFSSTTTSCSTVTLQKALSLNFRIFIVWFASPFPVTKLVNSFLNNHSTMYLLAGISVGDANVASLSGGPELLSDTYT